MTKSKCQMVNSELPVIPDPDRESRGTTENWIPVYTGMTMLERHSPRSIRSAVERNIRQLCSYFYNLKFEIKSFDIHLIFDFC